jgi:hypothetical protein
VFSPRVLTDRSQHSFRHPFSTDESGRKLDCTYTRSRTTDTGVPNGSFGRGSIPRIGVKAAIAAGKHPYPSRTRKLSPPAFRRVLECESLWENCLALAGGQVQTEGCNRKYTQGPSRWNPRPSCRRLQLVVRRHHSFLSFITTEERQPCRSTVFYTQSCSTKQNNSTTPRISVESHDCTTESETVAASSPECRSEVAILAAQI